MKIDMMKAAQSPLQSYINRFVLKNFNLKCKCLSPMENICVQNCGQPSLHCHNKKCKFQGRKHRMCTFIKLEGLAELLEKRFDCYKMLLQKIQQIEQDFIARMRKEREWIYDKIVFRQFQGEQIVVLEDIFIRKNLGLIKGAQIIDIRKKLQLENKLKEENEKQLKQFQNQFEKLIKNISKIRKQLIKCEYKQQNLLAASKIFHNNQKQQAKFVLNCLNDPKELKLLFRASQHQFSATEFYRICDGIPNLLVLVKTEFGKVIGGFNSIGWKSQLSSTSSADQKNKCFLFSVTLRQKMDLIKPYCAIYNVRSSGPLFGTFGNDLYLSDKCNQNKKSGSYFPSAYNFKQKPYTSNEQTKKLFTGSSIYNFGVVEYEVFKVLQ